MMYRANAAQRPRPNVVAGGGGQSFVSMAAHQVLDYLQSLGIIERAERDNRRFDRLEKRARKATTAFLHGLNGDRAMARRRRQRETGRGDQSHGFTIREAV